MKTKPFQITLFFTYGVSLSKWAESGLLQREVQLYRKLNKQYNINVQFITYGDSSDRRWESELEGIELLPVYEKLPKLKSKTLSYLQTIFIPWVFRYQLKKSNLFKTNQLWGAWTAVLSKWFFQKPLLVRCGYEFYSFEKEQKHSRIVLLLIYLVSKFIYSSANYIHISTPFDKRIIENTFKIKDSLIEIRPNWVDTDTYKPISIKMKNRVLYVGRLSEQKNIKLLLDALKDSNIGIDIVGDGELRNLLNQIAQKSIIDITFLGRLPNDQMPGVYNSYPIYVLCSNYEGNPKTLLEAMACGLAVIGTNVPGIREIIINGRNGILIPNNEPSLLLESIQTLLLNRSLQKKLGVNARRTILENNSMKKAVISEYDTYNKLINL